MLLCSNLEISFVMVAKYGYYKILETTTLQVHSQLTPTICCSFQLSCNSSNCHIGYLIPVLRNILWIPGQDDPTADQISGLQRPLL